MNKVSVIDEYEEMPIYSNVFYLCHMASVIH